MFVVCPLDNSPSNPSNNFVMQNCFFRASKLTKKLKLKISSNPKKMYKGYGIAFVTSLSWSFSNIFFGNLVRFGVGDS